MKGVLQSNKTKPKLCFEAQTEKKIKIKIKNKTFGAPTLSY